MFHRAYSLTLAPPTGKKCPAILLMRSMLIESAAVPRQAAARFWLLTGRPRAAEDKPSAVFDRACFEWYLRKHKTVSACATISVSWLGQRTVQPHDR
jgi:hypothetical protein